jgi:hypothetical protein
MSQPIVPGHECAVCGALKRAINHWWLVFILIAKVTTGPSQELAITQWRHDVAALPGYHPTCGNNCAQKLVERWLVTGSLDAPRGAAGNPVERLDNL